MPSYRTPGVYIEEVSAGPRPVAASSTTDTGFVAMLTLPTTVLAGAGDAQGMMLPSIETSPLLAWNRALAFLPLGGTPNGASPPVEAPPQASATPTTEAKDAKSKPPVKPPAKPVPASAATRLQELVGELLPGQWAISTPVDSAEKITLRGEAGVLQFPANRTLLSVKTLDDRSKVWDLSWGADEMKVVELIAGNAASQSIPHAGTLPCVDTKAKPVTIDVAEVHERLHGAASAVTNMTGYHQWRVELGERLFLEIVTASNPRMTDRQAQMVWATLSVESKQAWDTWLRAHPGMRRLELGLMGFFSNGGANAFLACGVQAHGAAGPPKRAFLEEAFDGVSAVAMLVAPGLDTSWQQAILEYAGPKGRGDLFAILETPRFLLTKAPRNVSLDAFRWTRDQGPFEMAELDFLAEPSVTELRFQGFQKDEVLDRCTPRDEAGHGATYGPWVVVENPISTSAQDRFVVAPPGGFVAGVVAGTDMKAGGGVHKAPANELMLGVSELVTQISDREQGALNMMGINIIRHRPAAGIRIWGARTVGSDPLWTYISVRRLFLMVERSVRDAVQWAVFLPNTEKTRTTLRQTISSFLIRLYNEGMLDGPTWQEAFTVKCDSENNPDVDVRAGLMTVDVSMRPVFPAEFIRIRFQQSAMQVE